LGRLICSSVCITGGSINDAIDGGGDVGRHWRTGTFLTGGLVGTGSF
jgi:hypothetical protein